MTEATTITTEEIVLPACPNCGESAEPYKDYNENVVGCEACQETLCTWCEIGQHWVYKEDARTRREGSRRYYTEYDSCVECEGDD